MLLWLAAFLSLLWFLAYVWPTQYRYEQHRGSLVRIERSSGTTEILTPHGWSSRVELPACEARGDTTSHTTTD